MLVVTISKLQRAEKSEPEAPDLHLEDSGHGNAELWREQSVMRRLLAPTCSFRTSFDVRHRNIFTGHIHSKRLPTIAWRERQRGRRGMAVFVYLISQAELSQHNEKNSSTVGKLGDSDMKELLFMQILSETIFQYFAKKVRKCVRWAWSHPFF